MKTLCIVLAILSQYDSVHPVCDNYDKTCFQCIEGHFLTTTGIGTYICLPCNSRCSTCSDKDTCIECKYQHYWGKRCEFDCATGFYQSNASRQGYECLRCPQSCSTCNSSSSCDSCKSGYWGKYCHNNCPINCITCASMDLCLTCKSGFNGTSCQHDCRSCNEGICERDTGQCAYKCSSWQYFDEADVMCRRCPDGCTSCTNGLNCAECMGGRWGNRCQNFCDINCTNNLCHRNSGSCSDGYVVESVVGKHGCSSGFWGPQCQFECGPGCMGSVCNQTTERCRLISTEKKTENVSSSVSGRNSDNTAVLIGACIGVSALVLAVIVTGVVCIKRRINILRVKEVNQKVLLSKC